MSMSFANDLVVARGCCITYAPIINPVFSLSTTATLVSLLGSFFLYHDGRTLARHMRTYICQASRPPPR